MTASLYSQAPTIVASIVELGEDVKSIVYLIIDKFEVDRSIAKILYAHIALLMFILSSIDTKHKDPLWRNSLKWLMSKAKELYQNNESLFYKILKFLDPFLLFHAHSIAGWAIIFFSLLFFAIAFFVPYILLFCIILWLELHANGQSFEFGYLLSAFNRSYSNLDGFTLLVAISALNFLSFWCANMLGWISISRTIRRSILALIGAILIWFTGQITQI